MKKLVSRYIKQCDKCQRNKVPRHKPYGLLQPLSVPNKPWKSIGMDFIVGLPPAQDFNSILCVVYRLTKMAHFIPCRDNIKATELATLFIDNVFKLHGLPETIISDRGSLFISKFWQGLMKKLNVTTSLTSSYHPRSDGQTERTNGILIQYLRMYCSSTQRNWPQLLPFAEFCYNNASQASSKTSPFLANYGFHPSFNLAYQPVLNPAAEHYMETIKELQSNLKTTLEAAQQSQEKHFNKNVQVGPQFFAGSKVWLMRKNTRTTHYSDKLDCKRFGPFRIIEVVTPVSYRLALPPSWKIHNVFHVSLLEPFYEDQHGPQQNLPCPPDIVNSPQLYDVENILDARTRDNHVEYLVDWKGYPPEDRSWEPLASFSEAPNLLVEFYNAYPNKPGNPALTT